jgi:hypothetical protein
VQLTGAWVSSELVARSRQSECEFHIGPKEEWAKRKDAATEISEGLRGPYVCMGNMVYGIPTGQDALYERADMVCIQSKHWAISRGND